MSVNNLTITTVAKGTNLVGEINELRYEILAAGSGPGQFSFQIPNARLVSDASPPPSTTTGGGGSGGGGGGGGNPSPNASAIATIAGGSVSSIFPSLVSKLNVSTASDDAARAVLFGTPKLSVTARVSSSIANVGLDVIPGAANPGVQGTVTLDAELPEWSLILAVVVTIGSALS